MKHIHVVAAVIFNEQGELFLAKRPDDKHQGGLWEFPGGKVESGETAVDALKRELKEEIDIGAESATAFINLKHKYSDKWVELDVYRVDSFSGEAIGKEGQEVRWVSLTDLDEFSFPEANKKIVSALFAPELLSILPENFSEIELSVGQIESLKTHPKQAVLLRAPILNDERYTQLYYKVQAQLLESGVSDAMVFVDRPNLVSELKGVRGLHLKSALLEGFDRSVLDIERQYPLLLSAACHNEQEIKLAENMRCDFILLSPVQETASHPDAKPLGWNALAGYCSQTALPVIALGGLSPADLSEAKKSGAFGVAGISHFALSRIN